MLWSRLSIERKSLIGFALAAGIFAAISLVSYRNAQRLIDTNNWVVHTYRVISELDHILSDITGIEDSQRGFIITGDETFLEHYGDYIADVDEDLGQIQSLTADNPGQQLRLADLRRLVSERIATAQNTLDLRRKEGFEAARQQVANGTGRELTSRISETIGEMKDEENLLLDRRREEVEGSVRGALLAFTGLTLVGFGLLASSYAILRRDIATRQRAEQVSRELNQELERRVAERTARLTETEAKYRALV